MRDLGASNFVRFVFTAAAATVGLVVLITTNIAQDNQTKATVASALTGGDAGRAPAIFRRYGCSGCHTIPGIPGADGQTGPPLTGLSKRVFIAGTLENTSGNLIAWIVSPESQSPRTAMPDTGISEKEARDLAAYLYAH
jgi:cytochrome c